MLAGTRSGGEWEQDSKVARRSRFSCFSVSRVDRFRAEWSAVGFERRARIRVREDCWREESWDWRAACSDWRRVWADRRVERVVWRLRFLRESWPKAWESSSSELELERGRFSGVCWGAGVDFSRFESSLLRDCKSLRYWSTRLSRSAIRFAFSSSNWFSEW